MDAPDRPARGHLAPRARLQRRALRPVARAARRLPAHLGHRHAVLRHRGRRRGAGRRGRLERGAVPDVVPHRRRLDGRLAGPRDGVPAGPDPVRLQLRAVPASSPACSRSSTRDRSDYPGAGTAPMLYLIAAVILALAVAVETYFQNERWPMPRGRRGRRRDGAVGRPDADGRPLAAARLRARSGDRRCRSATLFPGTLRLLTPFLNITGAFALVLGRGLQHVRVHAQAAGAAVLARSEPARRRVPVQPAHRAGRDRSSTSSRRCRARLRALADGPDPQPRPGHDPHRHRRLHPGA